LWTAGPFPFLYPTQCKRIFFVVSHNTEDSVLLRDTMEKNEQNDHFKLSVPLDEIGCFKLNP
jgi:hypothetical protein